MTKNKKLKTVSDDRNPTYFYRKWIERLQIEGRIIAACMTTQEEKNHVLEVYGRRVAFLRKCIAYYQIQQN